MSTKSKPTARRIVTVSDAELAARCARGRIVIIDDDAEFLGALASLLTMEGYAAETYLSASAYLQVLTYNQPSFAGPWCILCDVRMPEVDGLELQHRLADLSLAPMILMSGASGITEAVRAFRGGATDFLVKPFEVDALLAAIEKALTESGEAQRKIALHREVDAKFSSLTSREREVLQCVGNGHTNIDIATALGISLRSVKRHRQSGLEKLGAAGTADLVRILALLEQQ